MEAGAVHHDIAHARHDERVARGLRVFALREAAGPRRFRLRLEPCPLEALARRLASRRRPAARLAG